MLTDDSEKHCLNRKQPEITFREQQNLSRSVCRTQKSRFLHGPASLEPKNVMFGTPRIALLKKERCCCKYDLILQQPFVMKWMYGQPYLSPRTCLSSMRASLTPIEPSPLMSSNEGVSDPRSESAVRMTVSASITLRIPLSSASPAKTAV